MKQAEKKHGDDTLTFVLLNEPGTPLESVTKRIDKIREAYGDSTYKLHVVVKDVLDTKW